MNQKLKVSLVLCVLVLMASVSIADNFEDGVKAYESGDYTEAHRLILDIAKSGDARAQFNIGNMYNEGKGVTQDFKQAMKWYRLSAEQGYAMPQYNLGVMYDRGTGLKNKATFLYRN